MHTPASMGIPGGYRLAALALSVLGALMVPFMAVGAAPGPHEQIPAPRGTPTPTPTGTPDNAPGGLAPPRPAETPRAAATALSAFGPPNATPSAADAPAVVAAATPEAPRVGSGLESQSSTAVPGLVVAGLVLAMAGAALWRTTVARSEARP